MTARATRRRQTVFVGSKIRQIRKQRDLTQAELSLRIGVQQSDLCRMENGEYKVSLDTLFKILSVFGMDIGEFFRDEASAPSHSDRESEVLRLLRQLDGAAQDDVLDYVRYKASRKPEALAP